VTKRSRSKTKARPRPEQSKSEARTRDYVLVDKDRELLVTDDEVEALWKKDDKSIWWSEEAPKLYMVTAGGAMLEWGGAGWVVTFRPGAPSAGSTLSTWAEITQALADSTGSRSPVTVYVDDSVAPAIASHNLDCAAQKVLIAAKPPPGPLVRLTCAKDVQFTVGHKGELGFTGNLEIIGAHFSEERLLANVEVP
jgi:hypothetical protein